MNTKKECRHHETQKIPAHLKNVGTKECKWRKVKSETGKGWAGIINAK